MNCLKCPLLEDCPASKLVCLPDYDGQLPVPTKAKPYTESECPLLQAIETAKSIRDKEEI